MVAPHTLRASSGETLAWLSGNAWPLSAEVSSGLCGALSAASGNSIGCPMNWNAGRGVVARPATKLPAASEIKNAASPRRARRVCFLQGAQNGVKRKRLSRRPFSFSPHCEQNFGCNIGCNSLWCGLTICNVVIRILLPPCSKYKTPAPPTAKRKLHIADFVLSLWRAIVKIIL